MGEFSSFRSGRCVRVAFKNCAVFFHLPGREKGEGARRYTVGGALEFDVCRQAVHSLCFFFFFLYYQREIVLQVAAKHPALLRSRQINIHP